MEPVARGQGGGRSRPRRGLVRVGAVGASLAVAAAMAVVLTVGSPVGGPEVANAAAAVRKAATVTAASAERSGTALLRITRNGELWAGTTVRWHDGDVAVARDGSRRPGKAGSRFLVVDGTLYGVDPADGGWVVLGNPDSLDPASGTTPEEYLAAVRADGRQGHPAQDRRRHDRADHPPARRRLHRLPRHRRGRGDRQGIGRPTRPLPSTQQ
jgi:hypothetical protein